MLKTLDGNFILLCICIHGKTLRPTANIIMMMIVFRKWLTSSVIPNKNYSLIETEFECLKKSPLTVGPLNGIGSDVSITMVWMPCCASVFSFVVLLVLINVHYISTIGECFTKKIQPLVAL